MSQQEISYHRHHGYLIYPKWRTEGEGQNPETYIVYRSACVNDEGAEPAPDNSFPLSYVVELARYDSMDEARAYIDGLVEHYEYTEAEE